MNYIKLPILVAADDNGGDESDDTSEGDDGTWCYYQIAEDGSMIGCKNPS